MTTPDSAKKLAGLLRRLKETTPLPEPMPAPAPAWLEPAVEELVFSMLVWEARSAQAREAIQRLRASVVDYNELRVSLPEEIRQVLGERYPRGSDRAARLRATLNELYRREHRVTLQPIASAGKREARSYLETLEGMPHFVASRVFLVACGGHAAPVDERIRNMLAEEGVVGADETPETVSAWLERHVKAGDALGVYGSLQAAADEHGRRPVKAVKGSKATESRSARPASRKKAGKG